jgi:hypothetical protein
MDEAQAMITAVSAASQPGLVFSEVDYLRDVIARYAWALGGLLTALVGLGCWIYIRGQNQAETDRREIKRGQEEVKDEIAGVKQALFDEARVVRELFHGLNTRVAIIEDRLGMRRREGDRDRDRDYDLGEPL